MTCRCGAPIEAVTVASSAGVETALECAAGHPAVLCEVCASNGRTRTATVEAVVQIAGVPLRYELCDDHLAPIAAFTTSVVALDAVAVAS